MTVGLQAGEEDVKEPQAEEEKGGDDAMATGAAQFPTDVRPPPVQQHTHSQEGKDGEECDREGQRTRLNLERSALHVPVDGSHGPGHSDA